GEIVRIGGRPFRVIGVWQRPTNIFEVPGAPEIAGVVPFEAARERFPIDRVNGLIILVKPRPEVSVARAMDAATLQLRRLRGLRVGESSSFDLLTSDQVLGIFDSLTFAFFFVMLVLSSIALLVGGIGVLAIMMVSVTSRTPEIGLRKAMGATRRDVLWQFLVEAATLTLVGGILGIMLRTVTGEFLKRLLAFSTPPPAARRRADPRRQPRQRRARTPSRQASRSHRGRERPPARRRHARRGGRAGADGRGRPRAPQRRAPRRAPGKQRGVSPESR